MPPNSSKMAPLLIDRGPIDPNVPYGERLLPHVVDDLAKSDPTRLVVKQRYLPGHDSDFLDLTIKDVATATNFLAAWLKEHLDFIDSTKPVAYQGPSDFRYMIVLLALMKVGRPILMLSTRNTRDDDIHLCTETKCTVALFNAPFGPKIKSLEKIGVKVLEIPTLEEMIHSHSVHFPYEKTWESARHDTTIVFQTSGSTGRPKPVKMNHILVSTIDSIRIMPSPPGTMNTGAPLLEGSTPGEPFILTFPLFHIVGITCSHIPLLYNVTAIIPPGTIPPSGRSVIDLMKKVNARGLVSSPMIFDDLMKNLQPEFLKYSSTVKVVVNSGGPLSPESGKFLSKRFAVTQLMGSTEAYQVHHILQDDEPWRWLQWNPMVRGLVMEPVEETDPILYEMVIYKIPDQPEWMQYVFQSQPQVDVWRTRDLWRKHPTKDLWAFECRRDDTIVLNNGEKLIPVVMEQHLQGHPFITGAIVIGLGRDQAALLLELTDPRPSMDEIWPWVEEANAKVPQHGRIYSDMIIIAPPHKPFNRAGKGTIQRASTNLLFEEEVDALYQAKQSSGSMSTTVAPQPSLKMPKQSIIDFVKQCVLLQLKQADFPETSIFYEHGMDSLQTTELTRSLSIGLKPFVPPGMTESVNPQLVYENPSIQSLSSAVYYIMYPSERPSNYDKPGTEAYLRNQVAELVDSFIKDIPRRPGPATGTMNGYTNKQATSPSSDEVVLLAGSTGFLGYYILRALCLNSSIAKIICLNRSASANVTFERELEAAEIADIPSMLAKVEFITVANADIGNLPASTVDQLTAQVTTIIQNAWAVDFALSLTSFKPNLASLRHLLDFTIHSPRNPHLIFNSTIESIGCKRPGDSSVTPPTDVFEDIFKAFPLGYARSKVVAEAMLAEAMIRNSHTNLRISIVRAGQISGSSSNAVRGPMWNINDWLPRLLQTGKAMGVLPDSLGLWDNIDWAPVDTVADLFVNVVLPLETSTDKQSPSSSSSSHTPHEANTIQVYNITNPNPVHYSTLLPTICECLSLPNPPSSTIPFSTWLEQLRALTTSSSSPNAVSTYPALKSPAVYQQMQDMRVLAHDTKRYDLSSSLEIFPGLEAVGEITPDMIRRWIKQWNF